MNASNFKYILLAFDGEDKCYQVATKAAMVEAMLPILCEDKVQFVRYPALDRVIPIDAKTINISKP